MSVIPLIFIGLSAVMAVVALFCAGKHALREARHPSVKGKAGPR